MLFLTKHSKTRKIAHTTVDTIRTECLKFRSLPTNLQWCTNAYLDYSDHLVDLSAF